MATTNWEIERTALTCAVTGRQFAEDEEVYSAIYDEGNCFVRRDYATDCWPPTEIGKAFSFWKTRIPTKDAPVRRFVDDEIILDFFLRLEAQSDPRKRHFRYVLALLLMRKKRLKFVEMRRTDAGMIMVLHERVTGHDYEVYDPQLSEEAIQQVSDEVGQVLNTKF